MDFIDVEGVQHLVPNPDQMKGWIRDFSCSLYSGKNSLAVGTPSREQDKILEKNWPQKSQRYLMDQSVKTTKRTKKARETAVTPLARSKSLNLTLKEPGDPMVPCPLQNPKSVCP